MLCHWQLVASVLEALRKQHEAFMAQRLEERTNKRPVSSVTFRSILIGLLLLPVNVYWMSVAELKYDSQATALPLFIYPVVFLFFLTLANLGIRKL